MQVVLGKCDHCDGLFQSTCVLSDLLEDGHVLARIRVPVSSKDGQARQRPCLPLPEVCYLK